MLMSIGRILFALLFIFSGASKFATAYASQIEPAVGMTPFRLLAFIAAGVEVVCGLMIAFNLGARFFAVILVVFVALATFYVHDFWNQGAGNERLENIIHVMKNISIIGALLMIIGYRPLPVNVVEPIYNDRAAL
jgi:putative oxidoreductase